MTKEDANTLAIRLKGLMPSITAEQLLYAARLLDSVAKPIAITVIDRYVEEHERFAIESFRKALRLASSRSAVGSAEVREEERKVAARLDMERHALAAMSPQTRLQYKTAIVEALEGSQHFLASRLARADPLASPTLSAMIYMQHLSSRQS
jgi:hypothetical protein